MKVFIFVAIFFLGLNLHALEKSLFTGYVFGMEESFDQVRVMKQFPGYSGKLKNPTYQDVIYKDTAMWRLSKSHMTLIL